MNNDIQNFSHINYDKNGNENDVNEASDINDEPDDISLKDIYTGQTFTTFEVLEICLKRYVEKMGFEIRIVRCEKEDGSWARKSYKCHHGGKYEPKKKVDPSHNRNQESARIECGFLVNAKRYLSAIENHSSKNGDVQEETSVGRKRNKRQCSICKSWYHDSRNCSKKNECNKENV